MTNQQITSRLDKLVEVFPSNYYWYHWPKAINDRESVVSAADLNNSSEPVSQLKNHSSHSISTGSCGCNCYDHSIQCSGFAKYMAFRISGICFDIDDRETDNGGDCGGGWLYYSKDYFDSANIFPRPGDIIQTDGHRAIVYEVVGDTVYVGEALGSVNSRIEWGGTFNSNNSAYTTWSQLKKKANYVIKNPWTYEESTPVNVTFGFRDDGINPTKYDNTTCFRGVPLVTVPKPDPDRPNGMGTFIGWWPDPNIQSKEFTGETVLDESDLNDVSNPNGLKLYAHWASTFKISLHQTNLYLTVDGSASTALAEHDDIKLASANDSNAQKWLMTSAGTGRVVKSAIDPRFGFNIYLTNSICDVYRTAGNEHDALVDFILQSDGTVKIKLSNYNLYLTAVSAEDSANVKWQAASDSNLQKWTVTIL